VALDLGLHLGLGSGGAPSGLSAPVNSVPPAITGEAIVGHTLYSDTGTWSGGPAYSYQWYADDVAIDGANNDFYVIQDADEGAVIHCTITASNAAGSDSEPSNDTAIVAVPDPDAPVLARTSASGADPFTFSITWGAEDPFPNDRMRLTIGDDAGFSSLHWDGFVVLTEAMIADTTLIDFEAGVPLALYDPLDFDTIPSGAYIKATVFAETPMGVYYYSADSNTIQKTDSAVPLLLNEDDSSSPGVQVLVSDGGRTVQFLGNHAVRFTRALVEDKIYAECLVVDDADGNWYWGLEPLSGVPNKNGADDAFWWFEIEFNASYLQSQPTADAGPYALFDTGDVLQMCFDNRPASPNYGKVWIGIDDTWLNGDPDAETGGYALGSTFPAAAPLTFFCGGGGDIFTFNLVAADWVYAAPTDAVEG
jgi:hypothetical protein